MDYARWLLREQSDYTEVDAATLGGRLLGALLSSRRSVLLHGIEEWVHTIAASPDLTFAEQEVLASRMDELVVARRHVPFAVVTVSREVGWSAAGDGYEDALSYVNSRLSVSSDRVHLLMAGRVLGLSSAPAIPRLVPAQR